MTSSARALVLSHNFCENFPSKQIKHSEELSIHVHIIMSSNIQTSIFKYASIKQDN